MHVPVILVVGRKEVVEKTVAMRRLGCREQEILTVEEVIHRLQAEAMPPDLKH